MQSDLIRGRVRRFVAMVRRLAFILPLVLLAAPSAQAFDANINTYTNIRALAGFETALPNACLVAAENLRSGASPTGLANNSTGTSFIDFRSTVSNGSYNAPSPFAATAQEMEFGSRVTSAYTPVTATLLGDMCRISNLQIVSQQSPNAATYAAASYHGIRFRGYQGGVRYEWEVAFSGQSSTTFINTRTAIPDEPVISSVSPASGPTAGGTSVTITGSNLANATQVNFGGTVILAANFVSSSATSITVLSPARAAGGVDISVTTAGGTSADTANDNFSYVAGPTLGLLATVSATTQTVGRSYTFTLTPSATGSATSGALVLTGTLPVNQDVTASGTNWMCGSPIPNAFICTTGTSIAAGSNGDPVTLTVTPSAANAGFVQSFTLTGGGAAAAATANAPSVTVNDLPQTSLAVATRSLVQNALATPFTPVTRVSGGTAPFVWSVTPPLPAGLSLDSSTGQVSGTPTTLSPATDYVFTVTDARGAVPSSSDASRTASIAVVPPLPVISSISPSHGPISGGTSITINGSNFSGATSLSFGSNVVASSGFTINPAGTRITVPLPANATAETVRVSVTTAGGTSADTAQDDFIYAMPATISAQWATPSIIADSTARATLKITVTNPNTTTGLTISASPTGTFPSGLDYVTSSSTIDNPGGATLGVTTIDLLTDSYRFGVQAIPAGASVTLNLDFTSSTIGTYSFTPGAVSSSAGTSSGVATPTALSVTEAPPRITSLSPKSGPLAGGTTVVITGDRFSSATDVTFNGIPAQSFVRQSQTQITAVSPSGATTGTVRVAVTNSVGTSPDTAADDFSYIVAPSLSASFSAASIPPDDLTTADLVLTITNPNPVALTGVSIVSRALPAGLSGVTASTTCAIGTATLSSGAVALGGATIPANGSCTVTVPVKSSTPGTYSFTSGNMIGTFGTVHGVTTPTGLSVLPLPEVTSVSPAFGPLAGGTPVTITGVNFTGATEVRFGATAVPAASFTSLSATEIRLPAPAGAEGMVRVSVVTPAGASPDALQDDFTYANPPVTTASWSPATIPANGSTRATLSVTITNPNVTTALTSLTASGTLSSDLSPLPAFAGFFVGSATGTNLTILGNTYSIDIGTLPGGADVTLQLPVTSTTAGSYSFTSAATTSAFGPGNAATTATALAVVARPIVTSVSPAQGPLAAGTPVTISGANLTNASLVFFGATSVPSTDFTTATDTQITLPAPAGAAGMVQVAVVTPGGTSEDTAQDDFTYVAAPTLSASFSVPSIPADGVTKAKLTLTIDNPNAVDLTGVSISAGALPAGLSGSGPDTSCGVGVAILAGGSLSLSGATLAANASCTVTLDVTGSVAGSKSYTSGQMTGTFGTVAGATTATNLIVLPVPVVSGLSPSQGPLAGGTPITITGQNFAGTTEVRFGPVAVTSGITVNPGGTEIRVNSPTVAVAGMVRVSVVTPGGVSADGPLDDFTYVAAPTVSSFTFGSTVAYNTGAAGATTIDVATAGAVNGSPSSYSVSGGTPGGGTVSIDNLGVATYTPAVGFRGAFTFTVNASNAGGTSSDATVTVNVGNPTLSASVPVNTGQFGAAFSQQVSISGGNAPYSAFSATGLPDGLTISPSGLISGTPTAAGTFASVIVTATDSSTGAGAFTGTAAAFTLSIGQASQSITITSSAPTNAVVDGTPYMIQATGGASGQPVTFAADAGSDTVCALNGPLVSFIGVGTCTILVNQAANDNYTAAPQVAQSFAVGKGTQVVTFGTTPPSPASVGGSYTVSATGGASGQPVTISIDMGSALVCTLSGNSVSFIGVGTCSIRANQPGSGNYDPATEAVQSFAVGQGAQVITFDTTPPSPALLGGTYTVSATGGASGLAVTFSIDPASATVCTIAGNTVSFIGKGTCAILADQAGNGNYSAAAQAVQSFTVGQASQTIDFPDPPQTEFAPGDTVQLTAFASSKMEVVFTSLTPGICSTTKAGLVRFSQPGSCRIAADQAGNSTFSPAARVIKTLVVTGIDPQVETDLIAKAQTARASALVLNQPDLSPLLDSSAVDATALSVSSKGGNIDLIRMGGPVWLRLAGSATRQEGGTRDHYVQLSLGTHVAPGPQSILGMMATFDTIRLNDPTGRVEGEGWLIGPYFVSRLGSSQLTFELRALAGRTKDSVAQTGQPVSEVNGKRSLVMAKLSGNYDVNERLSLGPKLSLALVNQASAAYLAAGGTPIPGVDTHYRQASFGLDVAHVSTNAAGPLTLSGGLEWFMSETSQSNTGQGLSLSFGVLQDIGTLSSLELGLKGQHDFNNNAETMGLTIQFESRF